MATDLFLNNYDGILESVDKARDYNPCFQTLCAVEDIDHSGDFSKGKHLRHIITYPLSNGGAK
jgi:hypothetical protein